MYYTLRVYGKPDFTKKQPETVSVPGATIQVQRSRGSAFSGPKPTSSHHSAVLVVEETNLTLNDVGTATSTFLAHINHTSTWKFMKFHTGCSYLFDSICAYAHLHPCRHSNHWELFGYVLAVFADIECYWRVLSFKLGGLAKSAQWAPKQV